jgi:hypothetical protein
MTVRARKIEAIMILLVTISLIDIIRADIDLTRQCYQDLLNSYGMEGYTIPKFEKMEMCPAIIQTCCKKED